MSRLWIRQREQSPTTDKCSRSRVRHTGLAQCLGDYNERRYNYTQCSDTHQKDHVGGGWRGPTPVIIVSAKNDDFLFLRQLRFARILAPSRPRKALLAMFSNLELPGFFGEWEAQLAEEEKYQSSTTKPRHDCATGVWSRTMDEFTSKRCLYYSVIVKRVTSDRKVNVYKF